MKSTNLDFTMAIKSALIRIKMTTIEIIDLFNLHLPFGVFCLEETKIGFPFIADNLPTRKTPDGDDHLEEIMEF